jgi:hypothetical protein
MPALSSREAGEQYCEFAITDGVAVGGSGRPYRASGIVADFRSRRSVLHEPSDDLGLVVDVADPRHLPALADGLTAAAWAMQASVRPAGDRPFLKTPAATTTHRPMPAAGLPLFHEALSKLLELATVLRLAGFFLDLLGELLPLGALGEVLGPLEQ